MSGEAGPTPIRRAQPDRRVGFLGTDVFTLDGSPAEFKAYEIVFGEREDEDRAAIVDAARGAAGDAAARGVPGTAHHGLGFTVLHHGEDSEWLLVCWWTHECILCQSLLRADRGSTDFRPYQGPNVACTWELVVHAHERDAWSRHVLRSDAEGWPERYLSDTVSGLF